MTLLNEDATLLNPENLDHLPNAEEYAAKLLEITGPPPLNNGEMRMMYQMVHDTHRMIVELQDIVADLPAQLPQLMNGLPPTLRLLLGIK